MLILKRANLKSQRSDQNILNTESESAQTHGDFEPKALRIFRLNNLTFSVLFDAPDLVIHSLSKMTFSKFSWTSFSLKINQILKYTGCNYVIPLTDMN